MSRSLNKVMLIGYAGHDPEIRTTSKGVALAKLSLATSRRSGGDERTDWHQLTFFGPLVDLVEQWVRKGDRIYVEGRLQYAESHDEEGRKRKWCDVVVHELVLPSRPAVPGILGDRTIPDGEALARVHAGQLLGKVRGIEDRCASVELREMRGQILDRLDLLDTGHLDRVPNELDGYSLAPSFVLV